jgi:preprotein translocase subunit SecY
VAGSMVIIWLTNIIDTKGIGNGTSIIIFTNIITSFIGKSNNFSLIFDEFLLLQIVFLLQAFGDTGYFIY